MVLAQKQEPSASPRPLPLQLHSPTFKTESTPVDSTDRRGWAKPEFSQVTQTLLRAGNRLVVSEDPKFSALLIDSFEKIIYQNKPTTYIQHKHH